MRLWLPPNSQEREQLGHQSPAEAATATMSQAVSCTRCCPVCYEDGTSEPQGPGRESVEDQRGGPGCLPTSVTHVRCLSVGLLVPISEYHECLWRTQGTPGIMGEEGRSSAWGLTTTQVPKSWQIPSAL